VATSRGRCSQRPLWVATTAPVRRLMQLLLKPPYIQALKYIWKTQYSFTKWNLESLDLTVLNSNSHPIYRCYGNSEKWNNVLKKSRNCV